MKILFLINSLGSGGSEYSLAEMLPLFSVRDIQPLLVCLYRREKGVQQEIERQGFDLRFLAGDRFGRRVQELRHLIRREAPALIHTTLFDADQIGRVAALGTSVPVLSSLVNISYDPIRLEEDPNLSLLKWRMVQLIDSFTARFLTTHFHAVTQTVKSVNAADLHIPLDRITVIERGRRIDRLGTPGRERKQRARQLLGLDESDQVLVNVGRQEYQKGQRYLLEAVAMLRQRYPHLVLLIAGDTGNATSELEKVHGQLELGEQVRFLGFRQDIPELLASADLFVFPSLFEGVAGAVIEAMALGLPIVASNLPTLRDVVEPNRNTTLVEMRASKALAEGIDELLSNPARAQLYGKRSLEIFYDRFTLERSVERMLALYRQLVVCRHQGEDSLADT